MQRIHVIDSHTEGEPTRVVIDGAPDLGSGTAAERLQRFRERHDDFRSAVVNEPRGFDAMVGALLLEPAAPDAVAQMLFFNNVSTLRMCGHGTLGVVATLSYLGRLDPGRHRLESPEGDVWATLHGDGSVSIDSVFSYLYRRDVEIATEHHGTLRGHVAWGGNWFFLVDDHPLALEPAALHELAELAWDVRRALERDGVTGEDGGEIDHVELGGPPARDDADGKNFVLCPGGEYDRSPCGTGTSAKMACLAAEGRLDEGRVWRQESILGTVFEGTVRRVVHGGREGVVPTVRGRAWITAESTLLLDPTDPFAHGIRR